MCEVERIKCEGNTATKFIIVAIEFYTMYVTSTHVERVVTVFGFRLENRVTEFDEIWYEQSFKKECFILLV